MKKKMIKKIDKIDILYGMRCDKLIKLLDDYPKEANVEINNYHYAEEEAHELLIEFEVEETDSEYSYRMTKERDKKIIDAHKEKILYEELKKKYGDV